jgi:Protein of unknown function (DUF2946)
MDELVIQAMARWPDVPAVFGWLRLDRRGHWYLIDRGRPGFDADRDGNGSSITSPPILDFIGRNYQADSTGHWYWQNGPQRVYVDLDLAPLVLRVLGSGRQAGLVTHTGYRVDRVDGVFFSEAGDLFVTTELGPGVIHDLDLGQLELEFTAVTDSADAADAAGDAQSVSALWLHGGMQAVKPLADHSLPRFERKPRN